MHTPIDITEPGSFCIFHIKVFFIFVFSHNAHSVILTLYFLLL